MGLIVEAMLAQSTPGTWGDLGRMLAWIGVLIVVVVFGTIALQILRKRANAYRTQADDGFSTMEELRSMVARGEMSKEEFEQVRKAMAAKIRPNADRDEADGKTGTGTRQESSKARTERESGR